MELLSEINRFAVGAIGNDDVAVLGFPLNARFSKGEALNLAAWLVAVADSEPSHIRFLELLNKIERS